MNNIPTIIQLLQSKMEVYADPVILKINQPTPPRSRIPLRNNDLIAGLIKGNQWSIVKALFLGGVR